MSKLIHIFTVLMTMLFTAIGSVVFLIFALVTALGNMRREEDNDIDLD